MVPLSFVGVMVGLCVLIMFVGFLVVMEPKRLSVIIPIIMSIIVIGVGFSVFGEASETAQLLFNTSNGLEQPPIQQPSSYEACVAEYHELGYDETNTRQLCKRMVGT